MNFPTITAIVPARNEELSIEGSVRSLAAQPEIAEICVVNDGSTDGTVAILSRLAAEIPQLRVIEAKPLPSGWVGKNYAAWMGAQDVTTEWLLFTDADVRHLPGAAARALELAAFTGAALVSFSPRQRMETWWERAMIPFVFLRLAAHYSYDRVNDPLAADAAANGQFLLIRREAYQAIGGHRSVAEEVLEDVALARRAKAAGIRLHFAPGAEIAETRMYTSLRAMWQGWTKNLYPLVGGNRRSVSTEIAAVMPLAPIVFFLVGFQVHVIWILAAAALLKNMVVYGLQLHRHQFPLRNILWWGPGVILYYAALIASASHYAAGTVAWKGRTYPVRP